jgi:hypothetical protein
LANVSNVGKTLDGVEWLKKEFEPILYMVYYLTCMHAPIMLITRHLLCFKLNRKTKQRYWDVARCSVACRSESKPGPFRPCLSSTYRDGTPEPRNIPARFVDYLEMWSHLPMSYHYVQGVNLDIRSYNLGSPQFSVFATLLSKGV